MLQNTKTRKEFLRSHGIRPRRLAELTGLSPVTTTALLNGNRSFSAALNIEEPVRARVLARELGLSTADVAVFLGDWDASDFVRHTASADLVRAKQKTSSLAGMAISDKDWAKLSNESRLRIARLVEIAMGRRSEVKNG